MRLRFIIVPAAFCLIFNPGRAFCAEREIELEPIVVTQDDLRTGGLDIPTKDIATIDMGQRPPASMEDILDYQSGVDISRRSILGIQSDFSIRGSTPDQTRLSVDGIVINDPQTAHHNLDAGLPSGSVEMIEVIKAQAPVAWAQGTMGGAVNFVTKRPLQDEAEVSFLYGTDETHKSSLSITRNRAGVGFGLQAEEASSNGWRHDTDFKEFALASSGLARLSDIISSNLLMAYGEKEFGASYFYGPYNSKEWTDTLFLNWDLHLRKEDFQIIPRLYFRRHHDKYMLDIERPDYYINHHRTDIEGLMLQARRDLGGHGFVDASADINTEDIKSTRLGKHSRRRNSFFVSWCNYGNLDSRYGPASGYGLGVGYDLSLRIDDYSEYTTEMLPQAGLYLMLGPDIKLRTQAAKSARPPNYTELYYDSPTSKGNKDLSTEEALSYEIGLDISDKKNILGLSCTIFRRDSSNLIDWVKETAGQSYYQARNITELKTEGIETQLYLKPAKWLGLGAGYAYLDSDIKKDYDYISRYALNHPDHKVTGGVDIKLPLGTQNIRFLYKDRKDYTHYFIMGLGLNYEFAKEGRLFLNIENIFNSANEDIKDNPLPGRQIQAGVRIGF